MKKDFYNNNNNICIWFTCYDCIFYNNLGNGNRVDIFFRCIASTEIPSFNTSQPACPVSTDELLNLYSYSKCSHLSLYADYIVNEQVELEDIPYLNLKEVTYGSLYNTTDHCWFDMYDYFCYYYDLCYFSGQTFTREACEMKMFYLSSFTSNDVFSYKLYTFLAAYEMVWSEEGFLYETGVTATTQHFLYTCTTNVHIGNVDECVNDLLNHCFELEYLYYYHPIWCYYWVQNRLCYQFNGDDKYRCVWVIDTLSWITLEDQCSHETNEGKCVST